MSKLLQKAEEIGAQFVLIVRGDKGHIRFYKKGNWDMSRNCLLCWNEDRHRWDNSSELSFGNIQYGLKITNQEYDLIDFTSKKRVSG